MNNLFTILLTNTLRVILCTNNLCDILLMKNVLSYGRTNCVLSSQQTGWYLIDKKPAYNPSDPIYPTPPLGQDITQSQIFKWSINSEFSFS